MKYKLPKLLRSHVIVIHYYFLHLTYLHGTNGLVKEDNKYHFNFGWYTVEELSINDGNSSRFMILPTLASVCQYLRHAT